MTDAPIVGSVSELHSAIHVSPAPSDDEVVAIMAGVEALWPRPVMAVDAEQDNGTAWRFSGRWWSRPVPARRDRPFR